MSSPVETAPVSIERPVAEDAPAIAALFYEDMQSLGIDASLEGLGEVAEAVVRETQANAETTLCWIARPGPDQAPVGVLLASAHWSLKFAGRALWIEELYVTPSARRAGLGRKLVEHLLDHAEAHGIRGIDLEAYQGNTPASILYRSLGFHRLGRERFYYRLGPDEFL